MFNTKVSRTVFSEKEPQSAGAPGHLALRFVKNKNIDRKKWDACIRASYNSIIYPYSWYLDLVCDNWDALVEGNYVAVMPLPTNRKYFIKYVYQPFFCQQLGVFSTSRINPKTIACFLEAVQKKYLFADFSLNIFNYFNDSQPFLLERVTYQLELTSEHDKLKAAYNQNTKRNIRKSENFQISFQTTLLTRDFCAFVTASWAARSINLPPKASKILNKLIHRGVAYKFIELYTATVNGQVCAALALLKSGYKLIMLVSATNEMGRESRAMFGLIDFLIQQYSGNPLVLDFEGSIIPDVAFFYKGFGASPARFHSVQFNNLPFGIKQNKIII